mgnify:CR=1 FL=1|jgi:2-polyprenyl-3-methyl-5-hydroxy-6-metoxy-1,4-benzoquinol methylase
MFKERSHKKELLDGENIPEKDLFQNLKELDRINHLLGGYSITFKALKKVLREDKSYTIVDIGSGGGDTLKRIFSWSKKQKLKVNLVGVDLKQTCIDYSERNNPNSAITFICDDYRSLQSHLKEIDVIHACLFCHHLTSEQIVELIQFTLKQNATLVINDLQRNWFAYYSIKILTRIFSKSYLVKNDAPLSVLRGFVRSELQEILQNSGATNYTIRYKWAFRYEVIVYE